MAKRPEEMKAAVADSLWKRTGRRLEEWLSILRRSDVDPLDQTAVRNWLRDEHGVKQNSQWAIADAAAREAGWEPPTLEECIDRQYGGDREPLRPVFDRLRECVEGFGDDVRVEGRMSYIPFVRERQFAAVKAATRSRLDIGLRYRRVPESELLAEAGSPGQATHKVSVGSVEEIDEELRGLLRLAYDQNGPSD